MNDYPDIPLTTIRFSVRFAAADCSGGDDSATTRVLTGAGSLRALVYPQVIKHAAGRSYLVYYSDPACRHPGWVILDGTTDEEDLGLIDEEGVPTGNSAHICLELDSTSWYARRCSLSADATEQ
jgi:hypothetical protein